MKKKFEDYTLREIVELKCDKNYPQCVGCPLKNKGDFCAKIIISKQQVRHGDKIVEIKGGE